MRRMSIVAATVLLIATVATVPAAAEPGDGPTTSLELHCNDGRAPHASMIAAYLEQGCWGHVGMHTYFVAPGASYRLWNGSGTVRSVEQQFAPPTELGNLSGDPPTSIDSRLPVETSLDGRTWTEVGDVRYELVGLGLDLRQDIAFTFEADGEPFRYIRVREPTSATQGLSGFLDRSTMTLNVSPVEADGRGPATVGDRTLTCEEDILEDVFADHPCWFGGIDRYDAPSWTHTYPIDDEAHVANVTALEGSFSMAYWRPDDPGTCCGQTVLGMVDGVAYVQTSLDGVHWTTVADLDVTYGTETAFDVTLDDGLDARFVRVIGAKHPGYWAHPALKHPEGYLLDSTVTVTGTLPP